MLATFVIFYHTHPLGGFGADPLERFSLHQESFGGLAVAAFFVLSGFLITRSGVSGVSIWRFLWHRFLRIMPGYWMCLVVTAFVIAPVIWLAEGRSLISFFQTSGEGPFQYVLVNAGLKTQQFSIFQLPTHTPFPNFINGSLWTLSYEFACYLILALLVVTGMLKKIPWLVLLMALALIAFQMISFIQPDLFATTLPPFSERGLFLRNAMFFFIGASLFLYARRVPVSPWILVVCLAIFIASLRLRFYPLVYGITVSYIFVWLALKLPITRWGRHGDFSYGLYVYAFPIQQTLAAFNVNQLGVLPYFAAAFAITLGFAMLSYRFVEAPALRLKSLRLAARNPTPKENPL